MEVKMKETKEEINKRLIERTLMTPLDFLIEEDH